MRKAIRPAIFKWRQTEPELILCAGRWYLRYSLWFRDVEELLSERGPGGGPHDNLALGPALRSRAGGEAALSSQAKAQVLACDEAYVRVKGRLCFLYRAIDSTGAMIDFMLSGLRDAAAAKRLFRKALTDPSHPQPRVINTDPARLYGAAISGVKKEGILRRRCRHRPTRKTSPPSPTGVVMSIASP